MIRTVRAVLWPAAEPPLPWPVARRWLPWVAGAYGLIVVIATAGGVINSSHRGNGGVQFLLLLPFVAALALAPLRPLDGWRAVTLWLLVVPFLVTPPAPPVPPLEAWEWCLWVPALLLAGLAAPGVEVIVIGVISAAALGALTMLTPWPVDPGRLPAALVGLAVPLLVGASAGARVNSRRALAAEQARAALAQAERGALAERARIAREMHDVVAHHLSMITVRCETAPFRAVTGLDPAARAEISEIGAAARAAMTDMRGLLGVLRSDGAAAPLRPQPTLDDLAELVEQARSAGLTVDADLDLSEPVPDAIGLTVYRIVQEALTNARRHSPDAPVALRVGRRGTAVELVARSAVAGRAAGHRGHGLVGMRERVALHGGELSAGPDPGGGFTVRALVPVGGTG